MLAVRVPEVKPNDNDDITELIPPQPVLCCCYDLITLPRFEFIL